jgi:hypothetical protein
MFHALSLQRVAGILFTRPSKWKLGECLCLLLVCTKRHLAPQCMHMNHFGGRGLGTSFGARIDKSIEVGCMKTRHCTMCGGDWGERRIGFVWLHLRRCWFPNRRGVVNAASALHSPSSPSTPDSARLLSMSSHSRLPGTSCAPSFKSRAPCVGKSPHQHGQIIYASLYIAIRNYGTAKVVSRYPVISDGECPFLDKFELDVRMFVQS